MPRLQHERPLAFFDLETTGLSPADDRIVEISVVKVAPGAGEPTVWTRRLDPGRPIPPAATAVHGIRDADVAAAPRFAEVARELAAVLEGCDLAGFNVLKYDLPLLEREFKRARVAFSTEGRRVLDVLRLYRRLEPRTLASAVRRFLGEDHEGAHGAEADARATYRVLEAMLARHPELPEDLAALERFAHPGPRNRVDPEGRLLRERGEIVLGFGKLKGTPLREAAAKHPDYLAWILDGHFPETVKHRVREALERHGPGRARTPPAAPPRDDRGPGSTAGP